MNQGEARIIRLPPYESGEDGGGVLYIFAKGLWFIAMSNEL